MIFKIDQEIYPVDIIVSIGESTKQLKTKLRKYNIDDLDLDIDNAEGLTAWKSSEKKGDNIQIVMALREFKKKPYDIGTLVHECYHITSFTLVRLGIKPDGESGDEAGAYFQDYLVRIILEKLWKK